MQVEYLTEICKGSDDYYGPGTDPWPLAGHVIRYPLISTSLSDTTSLFFSFFFSFRFLYIRLPIERVSLYI
jgi:hypothetical protein